MFDIDSDVSINFKTKVNERGLFYQESPKYSDKVVVLAQFMMECENAKYITKEKEKSKLDKFMDGCKSIFGSKKNDDYIPQETEMKVEGKSDVELLEDVELEEDELTSSYT